MDDSEAKRDRVLREALGYRVELMAYARAVLGNYTAAEDVIQEAMLGAIPYTTSWGRTIHAAARGVSRGDKPPVVLRPGSGFRVRGRIASTCDVFFGVTVRHSNGGFAGKFQTVRPASEFRSGQEFDVTVNLGNFHLDPSLMEIRSKLPSVPFDLVVESMWCHTLYEPAGLEIAEVELLPPETLPSGQPTGTELLREKGGRSVYQVPR